MDNVNHVLPWIAEITKCLGEKPTICIGSAKLWQQLKEFHPRLLQKLRQQDLLGQLLMRHL